MPEEEKSITPLDESGEVQEVPAPATPKASPLANVDKEKLLSFLSDMIDTLNFKRVALVALLTSICLIFFSLYENREAIVIKFTSPVTSLPIDAPIIKSWVLSDASKGQLQALAKSTKIGFVIISDVDLKKNRRTVRYSYLKDPSIVLSPAAKLALGLPLPVFDYDPGNTEQMVATLSNEFRCDPYKTTIYYRHAPELSENFQTVCRLAIPPFVGQFIGFLTVGISGDTSSAELDSIRLEVSRIAVDIYYNDVMRQAPTPK
ncbi:hypothetical protein [Acinetobacter sp.]|uniref:hypothetical protein n=1 Tax=Acinetobacter sp. TaxID=472 RepID=UPI00388CF924